MLSAKYFAQETKVQIADIEIIETLNTIADKLLAAKLGELKLSDYDRAELIRSRDKMQQLAIQRNLVIGIQFRTNH